MTSGLGACSRRQQVPGPHRPFAEEAAGRPCQGAVSEEKVMKSFGSAPLKKEGAAVHPDEIDKDLSTEAYIRQARAYMEQTGDVNAYFCRHELLVEIK